MTEDTIGVSGTEAEETQSAASKEITVNMSSGESAGDADPTRPKKKRRRRRKRRDGAAPTDAIDAPEPERGAHDENEPVVFDDQDGDHGEIFSSERGFGDLGLRNSVLKGIKAAGFKRPTAIQSELIPAALTGKDVIGQAKTGTGKTAAFGLPLLSTVNQAEPQSALVLAPTRELAQQITAEINELGRFTPIRAVTIYGGQRISSQIDKLKTNPQIIVGTPGRVLDMADRRLISLERVKHIVLDEVDRMLDIGFREDIKKILRRLPQSRQTIFVSATISSDIEKLARQFMHEPIKLNVAAGSLTVNLVQQFAITVEAWDKRKMLRFLLEHEDPALTLVFCRLKKTVDHLVEYLQKHEIDAHAIHADLSQGKRNKVMEKFRAGTLEVLVASDVASRGIDVDGVTHVVNYDLPDDVELYVHRIGRTARAGRGGVAWSFVEPGQARLLMDIEKLINTEIPAKTYAEFKPGEPPEHVKRDREQSSKRQEKQNRYAAPEAPAKQETAAVDASKFPGGVVPTMLPPKRMHGRMRTGR